MTSNEVTDACRRPAGNRFHIVRQTVIPVRGMENCHRDDMLKGVIRQVATAKLVWPTFKGHVDITDCTTQRGRELCRERMHVLRPRTCQFMNSPDVSGRILQDSRDDLRYVASIDGRGLPLTEWQPDRAVSRDRLGSQQRE